VIRISSIRLLLIAGAAAVFAAVLAVAGFVLVVPAFIEHGPAGPVEPAWLGTTMLYCAVALTSYAAGFFHARRAGGGVSSSVRLGLLIGVELVVGWVAIELTRGVPIGQLVSPSSLLPIAIALGGSVLGGKTFRARLDARR
jgi:hypothetical protein